MDIKRIWALTPIFGTVIFVILYFIATLYYPGGSQFDKNSIGFSWTNNYWCNLLNDTAINGQKNAGQPIALTAMLILCLTLSSFWLQFPNHTNLDKKYKLTIQVCGTLAMTIGFFLFTKFDHDLITNLASLFGLIATIGTFIGLYKNSWKTLFYFGLMNILLVITNNFLYYNKDLISYLPIVQKITFATFLIWVCFINLKIFSLTKNTLNNQ
ncbi:MAG: hypothetical protein U0Y10_17910 [Spirosomataceae bacterium]